ncbi:MAG: DEAD/DEAH box helicase family protein [Aeriscardovia sp.]|nr:DEAD/DEAH box helicase family protein [Aeriscardovia sp.]
MENKESEEDVKHIKITPAIERTWKPEHMLMERSITDNRVDPKTGKRVKGTGKRPDYILVEPMNYPIAVVEAKSREYGVSYGMQQAKKYAQILDAPFAYSSNGEAFQEYDSFTGEERTIPLSAFPSPEELVKRRESEENGGEGLSEKEKEIRRQPYYTSQTTNSPRYYQQNAVNRVLDAIARGKSRLLLVMATGTGKTYTAFQIAYRLLKSGMKKRALYLADRNVLVDQSISGDFLPLKEVTHKIDVSKEKPEALNSYQVYFSLYQQLADRGGEEENEKATLERLRSLFRPDFFDLVIVDECHRGSAEKDSSWRKILDYFSSATQIGMTATPKETQEVSTIDYFGDPVYSYSLKSGIEDGFLAPFKVISVDTNIGDGWRPCKGQVDADGKEIEDRIYNNDDYDYNIVIEDRTNEVAQKITEYLKDTDRMQKTIVFCATEEHAERMRIALSNLNKDMVKENPDYVVRITGSDSYGKSKLDYFISVDSKYPVIATTSKLLSTGVDCKTVRLIVLDEKINSMTEFKQIIGRGTRIREDAGKLSFTVMDFRNVTRHFADPDWDGPLVQDEDYGKAIKIAEKRHEDKAPKASSRKPMQVVDRDGCRVNITGERVSYYDPSGKLLRCCSITDYTKDTIAGRYPILKDFINYWTSLEKKEAIRSLLAKEGIDLEALKAEAGMGDVDDFDFICHLAYDQKPLTRRERAGKARRSGFMAKYSPEAQRVLNALIDKYADMGIEEIEDRRILEADPFTQFGSLIQIANYFGGGSGYKKAFKELEDAIYTKAE